MKCQCPLFPEGGCPHHGLEVTEHQWRKCQSDPRFFPAFEKQAALRKRKNVGFGQRIANATSAAGRVVKAACTGNVVFADQQTVKLRKAACDACPERDKSGICKECGCVLKAKQKLATETCPLGKWSKPPGPSPE